MRQLGKWVSVVLFAGCALVAATQSRAAEGRGSSMALVDVSRWTG